MTATGALAPHKDTEVVALASTALTGMGELCRSLVYAAVITDDGFEVARNPSTGAEHDRLASMASSIQALSDAVTRELAIVASESVIIASANGHVVQRRIPGHELVLAALFDEAETLGKALSISRLTSEQLAARLAQREASPDAS